MRRVIRFISAAVLQENGVEFGVVDNRVHFEGTDFVDAGVEKVVELALDVGCRLVLAPAPARDGDEGHAPRTRIVGRTLRQATRSSPESEGGGGSPLRTRNALVSAGDIT